MCEIEDDYREYRQLCDIIDRCMPDIQQLTPLERLEFFDILDPKLAAVYAFRVSP